ncbi:uncharacterized protein AB9W97_001602 [Spinachia spinachia]
MSSVENLREFVNERLSAAAEEIFGVFKRTVVEYQEEIDRQRKLLDVFRKPEIRLHRIEFSQSRVCKEEEEEIVVSDQQLCLQERKPGLDQEDPDPPQIKEEQEKLCSSPGGEHLEPKQEAFTLTPTCEERGHCEDQLLDLCTDETQSVVQETSLGYISVESTAVVEQNNDYQLLSYESDGQDQKGVKLSLTSNKEPVPPGEKTFLCKDCGKYFEIRNSFLAHVRRAHRDDQPYRCNTCGKRFFSESVFKTHKKGHSDEKPFSCKTCGKLFKCSSGLKSHMTVHTGERPYSCITCGKTFTKASHLNCHLRIHSGEKPYSCITCGKSFSETSNLNRHRRIHSGEKPYSCITCGRTFTQKSNLKSHMRIHSGEKPYSCITCGRTFAQKSLLMFHAKIHTLERPYSCNTCGRTFTQKSNFKSHIRSHIHVKEVAEVLVT